MIDREALLSDLQKLLARLEADLLERSEAAELPDVGRRLRAEHERAKTAERTAQNFEDWRSDGITQHAAAWVLSCVFVRFLEDNRLIDPPRIAGPAGERLQRARDEHELYFRSHPRETDRDYLLAAFDELARLPGTKDVFGPHNPVRELPNWLSGDAATELLRFFQKLDANSGLLVHDFTDSHWDTRFLGDLYQDLSEAARKKYALLQTPEFVEEFILDRTLDPALEEFGLEQELAPSSQKSLPGMDDRSRLRSSFRMIDPACGSGHFLLGAFPRLLNRWQKREPGTHVRELVQRALDSIYGVDINPYAVAIARFRLLLAAMRASEISRLADAPAFHLNVVCGDSLLHAPLRHGGDTSVTPLFEMHDIPECSHAYAAEDLPLLKKYLAEGQYHAVVANPPYITPKDRALNQAYRDRYESCHMKYSLAVPFLERIYRLAVDGGYTGQITANSFMKREFGKKLIEEFLPKIDLTHVIDTSGAYIPGHGTPTVILFGRRRPPVANTIRTVMGIRGEPSTPDDAARGLVWSATVTQLDQPGSQSEFVSAGDTLRELFHNHPWSIGGAGSAELKVLLDDNGNVTLAKLVKSIGFLAIVSEDEAFVMPEPLAKRRLLPRREYVRGETIRDWLAVADEVVVFPYDTQSPSRAISFGPASSVERHFWPFRTRLRNRTMFGKTPEDRGDQWYAYMQIIPERVTASSLIAFAKVATHSQFTLLHAGVIPNEHAPVILLQPNHGVDTIFSLLGELNSSTACFWIKQVSHNKGSSVDQKGARQTTVAFENFWEHDGTKLKQYPVCLEGPTARARLLDNLAHHRRQLTPASVLRSTIPSVDSLATVRAAGDKVLSEMIASQEELDWECYRLYGLIEEDVTVREPPPVELGQRAFEIVLARDSAAGSNETTWFARHGSTPITELPGDWPEEYRETVQRRIDLIRDNANIRLIEQPEYKRRWNTEPWESQLERALREWLLGRLESYFDFDGRLPLESSGGEAIGSVSQGERTTLKFGAGSVVVSSDSLPPLADIRLVSISRLADVARQDAEFLNVGEIYCGDAAFEVQKLVVGLFESESVPLLPALRYKASGLRKRAEWEQTWELQREEDLRSSALDFRGAEPESSLSSLKSKLQDLRPSSIPVPPKYTSADFLKSDYWRLRGKLDVPKERWVSFPHCEGPDGTLVIAWAGYNHLQLSRAISEYYVDVQERHGGRDDPRLIPLLACLIELIPWLKQWHNDPDPAYDNMRMGDYFESFVNEEARQLGRTIPEIKAWEPPERPRGRSKRKT